MGPLPSHMSKRAARSKHKGEGLTRTLRWLPELTNESAGDSVMCDATRKCALRARSAGGPACLKKRGHWQYCYKSLGPRPVPKPGLVSLASGAPMSIILDATAPSTAGAATGASPNQSVVVALTHLVSYEGMGQATVSCITGCSCSSLTIDALQTAPAQSVAGKTAQRNVSVAVVSELSIYSGSSECVLRLVNTARSAPKGVGLALGDSRAEERPQKWKLLGVRVGWLDRDPIPERRSADPERGGAAGDPETGEGSARK